MLPTRRTKYQFCLISSCKMDSPFLVFPVLGVENVLRCAAVSGRHFWLLELKQKMRGEKCSKMVKHNFLSCWKGAPPNKGGVTSLFRFYSLTGEADIDNVDIEDDLGEIILGYTTPL